MATKKNTKFIIDSPVTLVFVFLSMILGFWIKMNPEIPQIFFCSASQASVNSFDFKSVLDYLSLVLYPFGFSNWTVFTTNLVFILLLCPKVEEVFGKLILLLLLFVCVVFSGVLWVCFGDSVMYGSSGIVCMLLILAFYASFEKKEICLSYILVAIIYFANEIFCIFSSNSLTIFYQFAGALISSLVGILSLGTKR